MKDILINIEKEIEEQLDTKTDDNDFTTTNVKGILKVLNSVPLKIIFLFIDLLLIYIFFCLGINSR